MYLECHKSNPFGSVSQEHEILENSEASGVWPDIKKANSKEAFILFETLCV